MLLLVLFHMALLPLHAVPFSVGARSVLQSAELSMQAFTYDSRDVLRFP